MAVQRQDYGYGFRIESAVGLLGLRFALSVAGAGCAAADENASDSATALEEVGSVSRVTFTKVINYPLFKLGENSITLKSLLVLGILFILVIVLEKVVRERVVMRFLKRPNFPRH